MQKIVHISPSESHYVLKLSPVHYEVYENGATHARRVGTFHYSNDPHRAFSEAATRCDVLSGAFTI